MRDDSARHSNMVTSCPCARPGGRASGGGGGQGRAGPGSGTYVRAGTRCPGRWDGTGARHSGTNPRVPSTHPGWGLGAVWVPPVPPWLSFGDPCPEPGCWQAPCPENPSSCHPWGLLHWPIHKVTCPALSPPAQPTLCKSKLIRLHSYRHRNMGCVLSLSINAFYHPIKLIKKQSGSSHQVQHPSIINLIFQLMIVSTGGGHGSWSVFVVYN